MPSGAISGFPSSLSRDGERGKRLRNRPINLGIQKGRSENGPYLTDPGPQARRTFPASPHSPRIDHQIQRTKKPSISGGLEKLKSFRPPAYFFGALPRLNFVVNFSTRPAVSTRRFSPV